MMGRRHHGEKSRSLVTGLSEAASASPTTLDFLRKQKPGERLQAFMQRWRHEQRVSQALAKRGGEANGWRCTTERWKNGDPASGVKQTLPDNPSRKLGNHPPRQGDSDGPARGDAGSDRLLVCGSVMKASAPAQTISDKNSRSSPRFRSRHRPAFCVKTMAGRVLKRYSTRVLFSPPPPALKGRQSPYRQTAVFGPSNVSVHRFSLLAPIL